MPINNWNNDGTIPCRNRSPVSSTYALVSQESVAWNGDIAQMVNRRLNEIVPDVRHSESTMIANACEHSFARSHMCHGQSSFGFIARDEVRHSFSFLKIFSTRGNTSSNQVSSHHHYRKRNHTLPPRDGHHRHSYVSKFEMSPA